MDFQEFNELFHRKDDNVIHLKYTDLEEDKDDKEQQGKKQKIFDFDSSENSQDEEVGRHEIVKKVLRGEYFHNAYEEYDQGDHSLVQDDKNSIRRSQKRKIQLDGCSQEMLSDFNCENSPPNDMRLSRKNIGTFHDECDKQQIRQIIQEMHNPQERIKMCLLDVRQQTIEELIKEINEANSQANPHMRKYTHHQRRGRLQTVIGIPNQVQMLIHQQMQQEMMKQSELTNEKAHQNRPNRQFSNHSTSNNMTSQSSMHTLIQNDKENKFGSGERGANNQQNQVGLQNLPRTNTQQFLVSKNMINSNDEIDNKGNNTSTQFQQQQPQQQPQQQQNQDSAQVQQRQKFNRSEHFLQVSKTIKSEDSNMLISIRIEHCNDDSQITANNLQSNVDLVLQENQEEQGIHKKLKNLNQKLFNKQTSIIYQPTQDELEEILDENQLSSGKLVNPQVQKNDQLNHDHTPLLGCKSEGNGQNEENSKVTNKPSNQTSPINYKSSNNAQIGGESSLQDIHESDQNLDPKVQKINNKVQTQVSIQTNINHKRQSSLDPNLVRFSNAIHTINEHNQSQSLKSSQSLNNSKHSSILHEGSKNLKTSQNDDEKFDNAQTSIGHFEASNLNDQAKHFLTNKMRQHRSNTVICDQDKYMLLIKKIEEMNPNHNHIVVDEQPQEGCVACDLQQLMKHTNNPKEKQQEQLEVVDTKNLFKEIPLHVIESRFFLRQISLLKQNTEEGDNIDRPFVMGNRNSPDLKPLRVYFFGREDTFIDVLINMEKTTVLSFVKFALQCYKQKSTLNKSLLKYPDQISKYKIFPNQGSRQSEIYKPMEVCEPGDNMNMADTIEESSGNACCLVEIEDNNEIENDHEQDLKEFQNVYAKAGQFVFKVECKEKEYYTFIRIDKDKCVDDIFEELMKRKKIDIDRRNYLMQAKIFGAEIDVELDPKMPLSIINDHCLKILRREYEDRQGGTMDENKQAIATNNHLVSQYTNGFEDSMDQGDDEFDDDEDEDDDDIDSNNQLNYLNQTPSKFLGKKVARLAQMQINAQDPISMTKYEEFEVMKVTYVSNEVFKKSKRIIGIDENCIYNRKVQPKLFSIRSLLCFLFPASPYDTKCPQKRIDDIKFMCIIDGGNLLIQFIEKDVLKQWLLYNPDPSISKKMYQKLSFLRKTVEVRNP